MLRELSRCPIGVDITLAIIKYLNVLTTETPENSLFQCAVVEVAHLNSMGKKPWMTLAWPVYRQNCATMHNIDQVED